MIHQACLRWLTVLLPVAAAAPGLAQGPDQSGVPRYQRAEVIAKIGALQMDAQHFDLYSVRMTGGQEETVILKIPRPIQLDGGETVCVRSVGQTHEYLSEIERCPDPAEATSGPREER